MQYLVLLVILVLYETCVGSHVSCHWFCTAPYPAYSSAVLVQVDYLLDVVCPLVSHEKTCTGRLCAYYARNKLP